MDTKSPVISLRLSSAHLTSCTHLESSRLGSACQSEKLISPPTQIWSDPKVVTDFNEVPKNLLRTWLRIKEGRRGSVVPDFGKEGK